MSACVGSCIASCCASCACSALGKCFNCEKRSRLPYLLLLFLSVVLALVLRQWGGPMLVHLYIYDLQLCDTDKCVGYGAVYRISFALFLFFMIHAFFSYCGCLKFDSGFWIIKLIAFAAFLVLAYLLPNGFFDGYVHVARIVGGVFLFLQIVLLVDAAYRWNEDWMSEEKDWKTALVVVSLLMYICSLILLIFYFLWFGGENCGVNKFFISFTLVFTLVFTGISISEWCEHGALLPSAVVTLYCWFLLFGALSVDPSSCNTLNSDGTLQLILGLIVSAFSISYAAWNLATSDSVFGNTGVQKDAHKPLNGDKHDEEKGQDSSVPKPNSSVTSAPTSTGAEAPPAKPKDTESEDEEEEEEDPATVQTVSRSTAIFHLVMAAASMYMAMLLTNWGSRQEVESEAHDGAGSDTAYNLSVESMWIKVVTQWVTAVLYTWSLLAPYVLTNRDFSAA